MAQQKSTATNRGPEDSRKLLKELVPMPTAATLACIKTTGARTQISEAQMGAMAQKLAQLITLYSVSDNRESVLALGPDDTQGGRFKRAGNVVEFSDGRTITGLAVTRTSLYAAIDKLRRTKDAMG